MFAKITDCQVRGQVEIQKPTYKHPGSRLRDRITVDASHSTMGAEDPVQVTIDRRKCLRIRRNGRGVTVAQPEQIPFIAIRTASPLIQGNVTKNTRLLGNCVQLAFQGDVPVDVVFHNQGCTIAIVDNPWERRLAYHERWWTAFVKLPSKRSEMWSPRA